MLPTKSNHTKEGCAPVSSNCVIWQGPDLDCIKLCKGDSVSDVVAKLAEQLCTIMDQTDISNYDLSCLELIAQPSNFENLIQLLITRICNLENAGGGSEPSPTGCPDCVVTMASCFHYTSNTTGNLVTTAQLTDYVTLIGNRICTILTDISVLQDNVEQNTTDITELDVRVTALEDANNDIELPTVDINCLTGTNSTAMETAIEVVAEAVCGLNESLGTSTELINSLLMQCPGLSTSPKLTGSGLMNSIPSWIANPSNVADSINNLWLTICDMRTAIQDIQTNCCSNDCSSIDVLFTVTYDTTIDLNFSGVIPVGFTECNPLGVLFTISGDGYSGTFRVPVIAYLNGTYSLPVPSGLNTAANFTISGVLCVETEESHCERFLQYTYVSTVACPIVTINPNTDSIDYSFNVTSTSVYYKAELWNNTGMSIVQTTTLGFLTIGTQSFSCNSLVNGTTYKLRVLYSLDSGRTYTSCPYDTVTTEVPSCAAITDPLVSATINFITT